MKKITTKTFKNPGGYDHDDVRFYVDGEQTGFGYIGKDSDRIGLMRCPDCDRENYAMAIPSGACAWCGWSVSKLSDAGTKQEEDFETTNETSKSGQTSGN